MHTAELPTGLRRALAHNSRAMAYYAGLSAAEQRSVVAGARGLRSARELQDYVDTIGVTV